MNPSNQNESFAKERKEREMFISLFSISWFVTTERTNKIATPEDTGNDYKSIIMSYLAFNRSTAAEWVDEEEEVAEIVVARGIDGGFKRLVAGGINGEDEDDDDDASDEYDSDDVKIEDDGVVLNDIDRHEDGGAVDAEGDDEDDSNDDDDADTEADVDGATMSGGDGDGR